MCVYVCVCVCVCVCVRVRGGGGAHTLQVTLDYSDLVALLQAAGFDILHQQVPPAPKRLLASFLCTSSPLAPTLHALVSLFIRPVYASPCPDSPA